MTAALALHGLHKGFGANLVLRGVDLTVPAGATTALVGPSGGGKTVLLKCAAGLLRPVERIAQGVEPFAFVIRPGAAECHSPA